MIAIHAGRLPILRSGDASRRDVPCVNRSLRGEPFQVPWHRVGDR